MAITLDGTNGITSSGVITGPDGSASAPAITNDGDTNTGIFFPAADTIAFGEGGTEVMRINSSGNVGIGTSSPATILNAYNATSAIISLDGDSTVQIRPTSYNAAASSPILQLRKARGTLASPAAVNNADQAGVLNFQSYGGTNFRAVAQILGACETYTSDTNISGALIFSTNAGSTNVTERMRIDSSGNLLVNTTTAQTGAKLAVTGGIQGIITSGTAVVNPTSPASSSIDFTGIPSWVKRITVMFSGLSLSSTADILVQLGDAGGIENTGYVSSGSATGTGAAISTSTAGMIIRSAAAASVTSGIMTIQNLTGNSWVASYAGKQSSTSSSYGGGDKTLSDTLTQIRITTTSTDTFDAGTVNIYYEG